MPIYVAVAVVWSSPFSLPGEMRAQLLNQTLLDLGLYDDGPYEVADQSQFNASFIPVPYHSYLGRICPPCSLLPVHRRESEGPGREGVTIGLRLYPNKAAANTQEPSYSSKLPLIGQDYFWMSISVYDSHGPKSDPAFVLFIIFPSECGWTCEKCLELNVAWREIL